MARVDALLQLHKVLIARRADLRAKLLGDLDSLHFSDGRDSADEAFDAGNEEVNCQLAELESDELSQIDRALEKLKKGSYGTCESCNKKLNDVDKSFKQILGLITEDRKYIDHPMCKDCNIAHKIMEERNGNKN